MHPEAIERRRACERERGILVLEVEAALGELVSHRLAMQQKLEDVCGCLLAVRETVHCVAA